MAVNKIRKNVGYGFNNPLQNLAPTPIVAERAPVDGSDEAEIGSLWINIATDIAYVAVDRSVWTTAPMAGATILASLQVTPGNAEVSLGNFDVTVGNTTLGGTLNVTGATTVADLAVTGDFDMSSAALIDLTSTLDAAPSIYLHANGGTAEQILLRSDLGTGVASISLLSDVGGITLAAPGLASADAINLEANSGGIDMDAALQINIASSQNAGDAIVLNASAGAIDILAAGAAGEDIDITNTAGSVNITAGESAADSIKITSSIGGIQILAAGAAAGEDIVLTATGSSVRLTSTESATDAINIEATLGGINILASGAAAGEDINLTATGSSVNIASTENAAQAIYLRANGGVTETIELRATQGTAATSILLNSVAGGVTMSGALATADAINIVATDVAGGIDVDCGTGGIAIDTTGAFSIDGATASNVTVTGAAADLTLAATGGSVNITATESAVDSVKITSTTGGIQILASGAAAGEDILVTATGSSVNLTSTEAAVANAILISASAADGGITLDAGATPGITFTNGTQTAQILIGTGSPNGAVTAAQGSLFINVAGNSSTTVLYCNTNGAVAWSAVGV